MNEEEKKLIRIVIEAFKLLSERIGQNKEKRVALVEDLNYYYSIKRESLSTVFKRVLISSVNRQGMQKHFYNNHKKLYFHDAEMMEIFENYDPFKLKVRYMNENEIFEALKSKYGHLRKKDGTEKLIAGQGVWYGLSKTAYSATLFFVNNFKDLKEFEAFIDTHNKREVITFMALSKEHKIHNLGIALTCDMLKESGFTQYGKPDTHVLDIFEGAGFIKSTTNSKGKKTFSMKDLWKTIEYMDKMVDLVRNDVKILDDIRALCETTHESPFLMQFNTVVVDKVLWIIGSKKLGRLIESEIEDLDLARSPELKQVLIERVNK